MKRTLEMKIAIPEIKGGRCVSTKMNDEGDIIAIFEIEEEKEKSSTSKIRPERKENSRYSSVITAEEYDDYWECSHLGLD